MNVRAKRRFGSAVHVFAGALAGSAIVLVVAGAAHVRIEHETARSAGIMAEIQREKDLTEQGNRRQNELQAKLGKFETEIAAINKNADDANSKAEKAKADSAALQHAIATLEKSSKMLRDRFPNATPRGRQLKSAGKVTSTADNFAVINLGADDGLAAGHTLRVFRMETEPIFLGKLEIVRVEAHRSVGVFKPATAILAVQVGDLVDAVILP